MEITQKLFDIIRRLRGEGGCEWDRHQTAESMWRCLAEEVYELEEAIAKDDLINVCEELGDVLFQLLFIIEIFSEQDRFTLADVVEQVATKMIRRHPHVYGDAVVSSKTELDRQWETIKAGEKGRQKTSKDSVLDKIPKGMPSLLRALKVSKTVVKEGFDWDDTQAVLQSVRDELDEFEAAVESGDEKEKIMEFGDILFTMVNLARFSGFHPETALARSTAKFEGRYRLMEQGLNKENFKLKELERNEIDLRWEAAKRAYDR